MLKDIEEISDYCLTKTCTHIKPTGTYIKTHSIQVHLSKLHVFVLFSSLSAFSEEKPVGHAPVKQEDSRLISADTFNMTKCGNCTKWLT